MLKEKFYTVAEVASITGLTQRTIRNYIKDNTLHGQKVGVQWRFTEEDIKRLFKETDKSLQLFTVENNAAAEFILDTEKIDIATCMILDIPDLDLKQIRKMNQYMKQLKADRNVSKKIKIEYAAIKEEGFYRIICSGSVEEVSKIMEQIKGSIGDYVYG